MSDHSVVVFPVKSRADLKDFINLPYRLHQGDPNYISPLHTERRDLLNPKKNPYLERALVQLWLAKRHGEVVGRISTQIDPLAMEVRGYKEGHFGLIAAENDLSIFEALTHTAENWLRKEGATTNVGPFSLNINEETGVLVTGHETNPMMMMGHDFGYVSEHLSTLNYDKGRDLNAYIWEMGAEMPATLKNFEDRVPTKGMIVRSINMKKYHEEVRIIGEIFNDAWSENWGFVPLAKNEIEHMASQLKPLIIPDLVWFVEMNGEPAAFLVCLPNLNEAIVDLKGKILPFGWSKILWRLKVKGLKSARVPLLGVRKKYLNGMLGPFMVGSIMNKMFYEIKKRNIEKLEMSWVLEDNVPMNQLAKRMGGRHYKTYRVFQKSLR